MRPFHRRGCPGTTVHFLTDAEVASRPVPPQSTTLTVSGQECRPGPFSARPEQRSVSCRSARSTRPMRRGPAEVCPAEVGGAEVSSPKSSRQHRSPVGGQVAGGQGQKGALFARRAGGTVGSCWSSRPMPTPCCRKATGGATGCPRSRLCPCRTRGVNQRPCRIPSRWRGWRPT